MAVYGVNFQMGVRGKDVGLDTYTSSPKIIAAMNRYK